RASAPANRRSPPSSARSPDRSPPARTTPGSPAPPPACESPPACSAPEPAGGRDGHLKDRKEAALMSAINAALDQIDRVAEEGDLTPARHADLVELEALAEPILLPDGKRIYPPRLHGHPIDELACALLDMEN